MNSKEILKELISFNTIEDKENKKIINYIEQYLKKIGFITEYKSKCLIMSTKENCNIGFLGHTDTVSFSNDWSLNPFELKEINGRLYGLGTSDMKGSIATILSAMPKIDFTNRKTGIKLFFTYDEEIGFSGINELVNKEIVFPKYMILLTEIGLNKKQITLINKYFNMELFDLINTFKNTKNEKIKIGLEEINNLSNYLKKLDIGDTCYFSTSLARGQNYYTGNVFEVYEKNGKIKGSIGAGGRYDKIIGNFINDGNNYPTVGISFGLSSIYELLKNTNLFNDKSQTDFYIIPINTEIESLKLANQIRNLGYRVEIEMNRKKIKKSMDYANKEKIQYVIVLGENEVNRKSVNIKNMFTGKQIEISFDELYKINEIM